MSGLQNLIDMGRNLMSPPIDTPINAGQQMFRER